MTIIVVSAWQPLAFYVSMFVMFSTQFVCLGRKKK